MSQIQSTESTAQSVASGIATGAGSVSDVGQVHPDETSHYSGNDTAKEKMAHEGSYGDTISNFLNRFVGLVQTTAAEFVGMDRHIAQKIQNGSPAALPTTSAIRNPNFVPDSNLFKE